MKKNDFLTSVMDKVANNNWSNYYKKAKEAIITPKYSVRNVVLAVIMGIILGIIALSIFYGVNNAFNLLGDLLSGDFSMIANSFAMTLNKFVILGFTGMAIMVGMRSGILNIGVSGQMTFGGFLAYAVLNKMTADGGMNVALIAIIGFFVTIIGAVFLATLAGILKAFFRVNEVISTIMLNWIIVYLLRFVIQHYAGSGSEWFLGNTSQDQFLLRPGAQLYTSFLNANTWNYVIFGLMLLIASCFVLWFIFFKTKLGFKMTSVGKSATASEYSGYNSKKILIYSFIISGVFAGLAAFAMFFLSSNQLPAKTEPIQEGFLGIVVALVGLVNPIGVFISGILFAILTGPVGGIVTVIPGVTSTATLIFSGTISYSVAIVTLWMYFRPILIVKSIFSGSKKNKRWEKNEKEVS